MHFKNPLIPANAGAQIVKRYANRSGVKTLVREPSDLGPGIRRDERVFVQGWAL